MFKIVLRFLNFLDVYGVKGLYALLFKVYWTQDFPLKNNGYDIISLNKISTAYYYGTLHERNIVTGITKYRERRKKEKGK